LRRLYKSLKFTHGRGKYAKRTLTEANVTEVRYALLTLSLFTYANSGTFVVELV
jgi:hypothetical protein